MPSLKDLRRRIRTVDSTKQITRAMKTVSASKMRRSLERLAASKPYAEKLREMVGRLAAAAGGEVDHPFLQARETVDRITLVLITADRGLCGAFNSVVIREAEELIERSPVPVTLVCVGKKGRDYFRNRGYDICAEYPELSGKLDLETVESINQVCIDRFMTGEADEVLLLLNRYINTISYKPESELFLPIKPEEEADEATSTGREYIFEPDAANLFAEILPKQLRSLIYVRLAEAFTAEHSARMISMTNANNNCEDLMKSLTLEMNKARQADITKEILEIVGGAEALKG